MLEFLWSNSLVATSVIRFCDVLCHIGKILQLPKLSLLHTVRRNICVKRWVTERGQPAGNTHTNTQIYTITEPLCQGKAETGNIGVTRNIKAPCHCVTGTAPPPPLHFSFSASGQRNFGLACYCWNTSDVTSTVSMHAYGVPIIYDGIYINES